MTISGQSTLNKDDIAQMVRDAEMHAEEDKQRRDEAEVRNNADSAVYQAEKMLRDQAETVNAEDKASVETPLSGLKTALTGNDINDIKQATTSLTDALQAFGQKLYEAAARDGDAAGTSATGQDGAGSDEEIIDAEIVDDK